MYIFLSFFLGFSLLAETYHVKSALTEQIKISNYENGNLVWRISANKGNLVKNKVFLEDVFLEWYLNGSKISFTMSNAIYDRLHSSLVSKTEITVKSPQFLLKGKGLYIYYKFKKFFLTQKAEIQIKND